jgi:hypothetical protein
VIKPLLFQYQVRFSFLENPKKYYLIFLFSEDKTNHQLKDLQSATTYEIELQAIKKRRHQKSNGILF